MLSCELGIPVSRLLGDLEGLEAFSLLVLRSEADQPNGLALSIIDYGNDAKSLVLAPLPDVGGDSLATTLEAVESLAHQSCKRVLNDIQVRESPGSKRGNRKQP